MYLYCHLNLITNTFTLNLCLLSFSGSKNSISLHNVEEHFKISDTDTH